MPNTQTANIAPTILRGGAAGAGKTFLKTDTSFSVASGDGASFPATPFIIAISGSHTDAIEKLNVTAISGDTFTVTRAQHTTQAIAWPPGSIVKYDALSSNVSNLWVDINDVLTSMPVGQSSTAPSLATSGTIATANTGVSRVTTAGAVTGVILEAGTLAGQRVIVVNESANSITAAAAGTSHIADGVSTVIAANTAASFVYDTSTSLWYHLK